MKQHWFRGVRSALHRLPLAARTSRYPLPAGLSALNAAPFMYAVRASGTRLAVAIAALSIMLLGAVACAPKVTTPQHLAYIVGLMVAGSSATSLPDGPISLDHEPWREGILGQTPVCDTSGTLYTYRATRDEFQLLCGNVVTWDTATRGIPADDLTGDMIGL